MSMVMSETSPDGKLNFANMLTTKRRRMRSGGNVSTQTNNTPKEAEERKEKSSQCKKAQTVPIFLKKTYKMIDTCDPAIASWTADGDMFVVKDPDVFAKTIIPQYFDHNKFSSFARQLNFYGFRKMQSKPIRNADFNIDTAKHVTFYNEKFKRGRCDLLSQIQRTTRGGGNNVNEEHQRELQSLKKKVEDMEKEMENMKAQFEERSRRLELDMLGKMEQMMLAMQQNQQIQMQQAAVTQPSRTPSTASAQAMAPAAQEPWNPLPFDKNAAAVPNRQTSSGQQQAMAPPTLPPHPKQKQLPTQQALPGAINIPPGRFDSLRGLSLSMTRGLSTESGASSIMLNNLWEMLGDQDLAALQASGGPAADQQLQQQQQNVAAAAAAMTNMSPMTNVTPPPVGDIAVEAPPPNSIPKPTTGLVGTGMPVSDSPTALSADSLGNGA